MKRRLTYCLILISLTLTLIAIPSQIFSQSQIKLLEQAYKEDSDSLMREFFKEWERMTPINFYEGQENTNDTLKTIRDIYKSFYDSLKFFKTKQINVIPNDINYSIVERIMFFQWYEDPRFKTIEEYNERRDTIQCPEILRASNAEEYIYNRKITNFRPKITNNIILFLDTLYSSRINSFLIGDYRKESFVNLLQNLNNRPDQFLAKFNFLTSYWLLRQGGERIYDKNEIFFYNKYLDLYPENTIYKILIDKTLKYGIVKTEDFNCSDYYYMIKTEKKWEIKRKGGMCWDWLTPLHLKKTFQNPSALFIHNPSVDVYIVIHLFV